MRITTAGAVLFATLYLGGPVFMLCAQPWHLGDQAAKDRAWHDTRRAGLSPDPDLHPGAVVQVFAARAWGIRGVVAEHTWIAVKPAQAAAYRIYQIQGWLPAEQGSSPLVIETGVPDRYWMGARPRLLLDLRGRNAQRVVPGIAKAAAAYPHRNTYRLWPGPNSNTFTAWMARTVPGLACEMPVTAVGKDYPAGCGLLAPTPSRTGRQLGLWGLAGIGAGRCEGLEINLLGLNLKIDIFDRALELPGIGRLQLTAGIGVDRGATIPE